MVAQFGGITDFPQKTKGVWRVGQAIFLDEIIILRVLAKETRAAQQFWLKLKLLNTDHPLGFNAPHL